ncbi:MAG: lysophospholipid acyltransferase family protein [Patescibacteria group bacterium]|jgi:1-acyl-sn-glycerol-3-phosphate acyltransferase
MKVVKNVLSRAWLVLVAALSYWLFKIRNKVIVCGKNNIPKDIGGVLFVSNHQTLIDSFLIGISIVSVFDIIFNYNRIPWNVPDSKNFFRSRFGRFLMSLSKTVPAHRHSLKKEIITQDINRFTDILKKSNLVLFFEGTRTRNGDIGDCNYGVAETIRTAKPRKVIPIRLEGVQAIMPIESGFNFAKIYGGNRGKIIFGPAIKFSDITNLEKIKIEVKEAVKRLSS